MKRRVRAYLAQRLAVSGGILLRKEVLDILDVLVARKAREGDANERADREIACKEEKGVSSAPDPKLKGLLTLEAEGDLIVVVLEEGPHLPLGLAVVGEATEEGGCEKVNNQPPLGKAISNTTHKDPGS